MEASQQSSDESQTKRKAHQHHTGPVLCPTNDRENTDKDVFYQQFQAEVDAEPRHDLTIVMGDLNAKVGSDNMCCDRAMGKHGCGTRNENGERLIDCCNMNNLAIGGTLFSISGHPQADTVLNQWQQEEPDQSLYD